MDNFFPSTSILFNLSIPIELENLVRRHFTHSNSMYSTSTEFIFILMYALIGCLGIGVNLIVILVILSTKRLRNSEHDLILNLCAADILLCFWCIPFTLYQILRRDWSLGQLMCSAVPFLQATIVFVIAQTITVIAFDRFSVITGQHSLKRKHWSTLSARMSSGGGSLTSTTYCCPLTKRIPLIWISSFLLGSPLIYFYKEVNFNYNGIPLYNRCIEDWSGQVRIIYSTITFTVSLVVPIICLVASQIKIVTFLKRQGNNDSRPVAVISRGTVSSIGGLQSTSNVATPVTVSPKKIATESKTEKNQSDLINNNNIDRENAQLEMDKGSKSMIFLTAETESCMNNVDENSNLTNISSKNDSNNLDSNVNTKINNNKILSSVLKKARPLAPLARYSVTLRPVRFKLSKGNRNRRAIISLYRVSVTFILSWLPLNMVNLYLDLIDPPSISGAKVYLILGVCHLIAISSSVTNAIFYGLMNTNIKRELSKIRGKLKRKTNHSSQLSPTNHNHQRKSIK
ncbi:neuropeptide Y receptor type 6-like [Panonychus citri]|uniref:neuropeptide Y receptor type 6-like n=1 Tax=Panonychus citri TaxID=50023 RepID=UPI0023081FAB|nr:neuropeptide Y receptor type 6-like [Panonychus citri]